MAKQKNELDGLQKSAILLIALGPEKSAKIFKHLKEDEIEQLTLEIVYKNIDELLPYINNARTHDEMQINQIASSIKEFGFNSPIAIDSDNMILCGHGRLLGAKKLGLKEVPTVCLSHLTPQEKKAYILADNKIALNSGWNFDLLNPESTSRISEGTAFIIETDCFP